MDIIKMQRAKDVGPLSYTPYNPNLRRSDHQRKGTIGNSKRTNLVNPTKIPGPGNYEIRGPIESNAVDHPRFHMGMKTGNIAGRHSDFPGPGEYETDIIPIHHANLAHFIGTGVRSDLGIGKAYMYPGPGEYEAEGDYRMDPRIRIAGTFGTQMKDTRIKKTFEPGPGSYELPTSVGLMPQYLRTEENKAAREA